MATKSFPPKFISAALISISAAAVILCGLFIFRVIRLPIDVVRENLSITDAQSLVRFQICLPTYIPPEIDTSPQIIFESDAANVPEETYIRLRYRFLDNRKKAFEVYQRYTPDLEMKTEYADAQFENLRKGAAINMVWWLLEPKRLSEPETDKAIEQIKLKTSYFEMDQTVWWLYEINNSSEYSSIMTEWVKDHVAYRIPSILPSEEIQKVTLSMLSCSNP